jgi:hypothetical protein
MIKFINLLIKENLKRPVYTKNMIQDNIRL